MILEKIEDNLIIRAPAHLVTFWSFFWKVNTFQRQFYYTFELWPNVSMFQCLLYLICCHFFDWLQQFRLQWLLYINLLLPSFISIYSYGNNAMAMIINNLLLETVLVSRLVFDGIQVAWWPWIWWLCCSLSLSPSLSVHMYLCVDIYIFLSIFLLITFNLLVLIRLSNFYYFYGLL